MHWSSLGPQATLLMPLNGHTESVLVFHDLTGLAKSKYIYVQCDCLYYAFIMYIYS